MPERNAPDPAAAQGIAFIDGGYCLIAEARVPVLDWGFLRSDATYDVVHVWQGRFFRLDLHLARFARSMARLRLDAGRTAREIEAILHECVHRSGLRDAYVEMICSRGVPPPGSRDPRDAENRFLAFAIPFGWVATPEQRARGLHLIISSVRRIPPESVDPRVKNYHWLDLVQGLFEAYERGGETVVLVDAEGRVCEGPGFNVFAVTGGRVTTPDAGVLEGITRRTALELCQELGVEARPAPMTAEALRRADEVFITSTAGGIMPVTRIDGEAVGEGAPGPLTRRLTALYWEKHRDPVWSTPVRHG